MALAFAMGGYHVALHDIAPEMLTQAQKLNEANLQVLVNEGFFDSAQCEVVLRERIRYTGDLADALSGADLVTEAIIEKADAKKELFKELDRLAPPDAILASNTSYLDIFRFIETERPDKVLITHWFAPPHIIPLVEIVVGPETSIETTETVQGILESLGKETIVLEKFLPGFIVNRLQSAITREVYFLIDNGYALPKDIDRVAKISFGLRTPILGLVQRLDFNGLDIVQRNLQNKSYEQPPWSNNSKFLDALVSEGKLGVKSGQGFYDYRDKGIEETLKDRDTKLLQLKRFLLSCQVDKGLIKSF